MPDIATTTANVDLSSASISRTQTAVEPQKTEPETETVPEREAPADPFTAPEDPAGPGRAPSTRPDRTVPSHPEPAPKIVPRRRPGFC